MNQNEEWRPIIGYEGLYSVSSLGRVKSHMRVLTKKRKSSGLYYDNKIKEKYLTPSDSHGYRSVVLSKGGRPKTHAIHRLVAKAFIPNPANLPQINHKDEDKSNNSVENLEWCDNSYNQRYGTLPSRKSILSSRSIAQYSLDGEFIRVYPSIREAARINGFKCAPICACSTGRTKTSYGFIWRTIGTRRIFGGENPEGYVGVPVDISKLINK